MGHLVLCNIKYNINSLLWLCIGTHIIYVIYIIFISDEHYIPEVEITTII